MKILSTLFIGLVLSGCASFGEGIVNALLDSTKETQDPRKCKIIGKAFPGISSSLDTDAGATKILMVHGVGSHIPGYSTEFLEKLSKELGLNVKNRIAKEVSLTHPDEPDKKLGTLRVQRQSDESGAREMLFYELTWSAITDDDKKVLSYDNSGEYSYRRALVNDLLKKFSNDTGPDPMIYLGDQHDDFIMAFKQSFCWMIKKDWDNLPENSSDTCVLEKSQITDTEIDNLVHDEFAIVSHSLGSRITIDGMQKIAEGIAKNGTGSQIYPGASKFIAELKNKEIPLYMLSNQLPLLQMGQKIPKHHGNQSDYCSAQGSHYADRILKKTSIIAFSDPNDLLSYAIPRGFVEQYLDARLCIEVVNIDINVAKVIDLISQGEFASPLSAHTDYDRDDRVVALIAKGRGNPYDAKIVRDRCEWTRLVD